MQISGIELFPVRIPMESEQLSFGRVDTMHFVLVRLKEASGVDGWGEAAILQGPYWSSESQESVYYTIARYLSPLILGKEMGTAFEAQRLMDGVRGNPFAKAAIEMALMDIEGKMKGKSVASMLGGRRRDKLAVSWTLAANDAARDCIRAEEMISRGWTILKVKVGSLPVEDEILRVRRIFEIVRGRAGLRIDANQGWSMKQAIQAFEKLDRLGLDFIEQPLRKGDFDGLAKLASCYSTPIMADESAESPEDVSLIARDRCASIISYKIEKSGGFSNSAEMERIAFENGLEGYMGCMIETSIGNAAYAAFASCVRKLSYGTELFGPLRLSEDVAASAMTYDNGHLRLSEAPGLGIKVDMDRVGKYSCKGWDKAISA